MGKPGQHPAEDVSALRERAKQAYERDEYTEAQALFHKALDACRAQPHPDRDAEISLLEWLGFVAQKQAKWPEARWFHEEQLRRARRAKKTEAIGTAYHRLGDTFLEMKDRHRARHCLSVSVKCFRRLPGQPRDEIPHLLNDLSQLEENAKNYSSARTHYLAWVAYLHEHRLPGASYAYYKMGWLAVTIRHLGTAEEMFYNSLLAAQETGDARRQAYAYCGLGHVHEEKRQHDRACQFLAECVRLAEMVDGVSLLAWTHRQWGGAEWSAGRMSDALRHYAIGARFAHRGGYYDEAFVTLDSTAAALMSLKHPHPAAAALCYGRAEALPGEKPNPPSRALTYRRACESALGDERFREWTRLGACLSVDRATNIALCIADAQPNTSGH